MNIVQFAGKFYHKECFDSFLQTQKSQNRVSSDYVPNLKNVEENELDDEDVCEECSVAFLKEDDEVSKKVDEDDGELKKDDIVDTPTPTPPYRRRR